MKPLLLLALLLLAGCSRSPEPPLPDVADVKGLRFQWWPPPKREERLVDANSHVIGEILAALKPSGIEEHPITWTVHAALNFTMADGRIEGIVVFERANGSLVFESGDTYFSGGPLNKLDEALAKASR